MASTTKSGAESAKGGDEKSEFSEERAAIEEQLARIKSDISELASTLGTIGSRRVEGARGDAEDRLRELRRAGEDAIEELRTQLRSVERDLARKAEEKPLQSLGIAAGIGFLVGMILRR